MYYNRYDSKMQAKACMRGAYPHPMLVTLIFLLATSLVSMLVFAVVGNPFNDALNYMLDMDMYDFEMAFRLALTPGRLAFFWIINIILSLYMWVMRFGYTSYSLRLARGEQPSYRNLLDGFAVVGRALLVTFFTMLFTSLWGMLGLVPYVLLLALGAVFQNVVLMMLAIPALIFGVVLEVIVSYRYRLATYFLLDNPNMGVLESIRCSKQSMRGYKGVLFAQDWSFFGWLILTPFTLYILGLWLSPYMGAAEANFYDYVVHGQFGPPQQPPLSQGGAPSGDRPELTF